VVLAVVGAFGAFAMMGHRDAPYWWVKLTAFLTLSAGCLLLTRERSALDTFSGVLAALFALCAIAMTAGDRSHPTWWPLFLGFALGAVLLVFLTRKKREALAGIAVIVGFRLIVSVILYALHR
jgi:uncharacterized membrane protein HdeD (DUF308 family)